LHGSEVIHVRGETSENLLAVKGNFGGGGQESQGKINFQIK
jgi:hypothetical protein